MYARLELPPYAVSPPPSPGDSVFVSPSASPIILTIGPQQLKVAAAVLHKLHHGSSTQSRLGPVLCLSLLCNSRQLYERAQADPRGAFRVVLFRSTSPSHVFRGTWGNVIAFAASKFPAVASLLKEYQADLESTPFHVIEEAWGLANGFRDGFLRARQRDDLFMSARRLAGLRFPTLGDVRYFLFCVLHLGPGFAGDGWLYDSADNCVGEEWFAQNTSLRYGDDCYIAHIPARVVLAAVTPAPAFASPGSVFASPETTPARRRTRSTGTRGSPRLRPRTSTGAGATASSVGGSELAAPDEVESRQGDGATPRWSSASGSDAVPTALPAPVADGHTWVSIGVTAVAALIVGITLKLK